MASDTRPNRQGAVAPEPRRADAMRQAHATSPYEATYLRAENEDDDGYDPYSDRPARPEPLFERDPWS